MMTLIQQEQQNSCGAAAYRQILSFLGVSISEKEARKDCKSKNGTYTEDVYNALVKRFPSLEIGITECIDVDFETNLHWLDLSSNKRIIYLSSVYVSNWAKKGRNEVRRHASVLKDGTIFDPGESRIYPIETYFNVFNKKLTIRKMILVDIK